MPVSSSLFAHSSALFHLFKFDFVSDPSETSRANLATTFDLISAFLLTVTYLFVL